MQIIIRVQCLDDSCFCVLLFLMYYCLCCCHSSFEGLEARVTVLVLWELVGCSTVAQCLERMSVHVRLLASGVCGIYGLLGIVLV